MPATFWKANGQVIGIYDLMIERYGFSIAYPEMELTHSNYLVYGETGNYDIWIFLFWNADGLISINFWIPDYYREEALETWEGDIDSYLYNPNHWVECSSCEGTGDFSKCNGWGGTSVGRHSNFKHKCDNCGGSGDCPDCWDGYTSKSNRMTGVSCLMRKKSNEIGNATPKR